MTIREQLHRAVARRLPAELTDVLRLKGHAARARTATDTAFAGESEYLAGIFRALDITGGTAVDIAAGDGVTHSCTLPLFRAPTWAGLAVECDPDKFAWLAFAYRHFPGVQCAQAKVTPSSVGALLRAFDVAEDFTFLNLDIDSFDLAVLEAMLVDYHPRVISMEINERIPPPIAFAVTYDPAFTWGDGAFYGCSVTAAVDALTPHGYALVGVEYNNAVFVRQDQMGALVAVAPEEAYAQGYASRPDRLTLFPWNAPFEPLLTMTPEAVMAAIRATFGPEQGRYVLHHAN